MSYLRYLCLLTHSGVQRISCCAFVLFFFVFLYSMLPFSWDFPFLIAPSVFFGVYLIFLNFCYVVYLSVLIEYLRYRVFAFVYLLHKTCVLIFVHIQSQRVTTLPKRYHVRHQLIQRKNECSTMVALVEQPLITFQQHLGSLTVFEVFVLFNHQSSVQCSTFFVFSVLFLVACILCLPIYGF